MESKRPAVYIIEIESYPIAKISHLVTAANLPEAGQSRLHAQTAPLRTIFATFHFVDGQRARPDQAHVAQKHVQQLWQFVEAPAAQEATERGNTRIIFQFKNRPTHLIECFQFGLAHLGIGGHGTEFQHDKRFAETAGALLPKKNRTGDVRRITNAITTIRKETS